MQMQRDAGLVRALGPLGLAGSIVSMMVGAGIFCGAQRARRLDRTLCPLAFAACSLGIRAVAICCAEGGSRMPTSGGMYGYIEGVLGPRTGHVAGTFLWAVGLLASAALAAALADVAANLVPSTLTVALRTTVIAGVVGGIALVNIGGVVRGARLVTAGTALKLVPLVIFVVSSSAVVHLLQSRVVARGAT